MHVDICIKAFLDVGWHVKFAWVHLHEEFRVKFYFTCWLCVAVGVALVC